MILLDTSIVSEVMRPNPAVAVVRWLDRNETSNLYLSTVTIAEIAFGLRVLQAGSRRRELSQRFDDFVARGFEQRLLAFDLAAAREYAEIMGYRRELGRPLSVPDGQIAAIARCHRFSVATRNVRDFEHCGLEVLNPFGD